MRMRGSIPTNRRYGVVHVVWCYLSSGHRHPPRWHGSTGEECDATRLDSTWPDSSPLGTKHQTSLGGGGAGHGDNHHWDACPAGGSGATVANTRAWADCAPPTAGDVGA